MLISDRYCQRVEVQTQFARDERCFRELETVKKLMLSKSA